VHNTEWIDLAKHRLMTAAEDYETAVKMLDNGLYRGANNRAYYSILHAMRAVLALEGKDFKKHSALISYFRKSYIKVGAFNKDHSDIISASSNIRHASDYDDFYIADKTETQEQVESAKIFYDAVEEYLNHCFEEA